MEEWTIIRFTGDNVMVQAPNIAEAAKMCEWPLNEVVAIIRLDY